MLQWFITEVVTWHSVSHSHLTSCWLKQRVMWEVHLGSWNWKLIIVLDVWLQVMQCIALVDTIYRNITIVLLWNLLKYLDVMGYLLTRLASWTLALPTAPWPRVGLYVMDLRVCQVTSVGLSVVVNTAPGFLALISLSTSHTCWGPGWHEVMCCNKKII